jgi:NitT/TauT family transport system ATP-binding protein
MQLFDEALKFTNKYKDSAFSANASQIAILLPRPSRVSEIIRPSNFRAKGVDAIRRDSEYLDIVDDIWTSLRSYVE